MGEYTLGCKRPHWDVAHAVANAGFRQHNVSPLIIRWFQMGLETINEDLVQRSIVLFRVMCHNG